MTKKLHPWLINVVGFVFQKSFTMQLFIRASQTHVVEVTGSETVNDVKVMYIVTSVSSLLVR